MLYSAQGKHPKVGKWKYTGGWFGGKGPDGDGTFQMIVVLAFGYWNFLLPSFAFDYEFPWDKAFQTIFYLTHIIRCHIHRQKVTTNQQEGKKKHKKLR